MNIIKTQYVSHRTIMNNINNFKKLDKLIDEYKIKYSAGYNENIVENTTIIKEIFLKINSKLNVFFKNYFNLLTLKPKKSFKKEFDEKISIELLCYQLIEEINKLKNDYLIFESFIRMNSYVDNNQD